MTPNIADIIRHHVSLEVRWIDRLYLHAWMPKLQTSGGLCYFLQEHLGHPIPSPALFKPIHDRFVNGVKVFAERQHLPWVTFEAKQRKDDVVAPYRRHFTGRDGVVVIGVAQEKMRSFKAQKRHGPGTKVTFDSRVNRSRSTTTTSMSRTASGAPRFSKSGPTSRTRCA